MEKNEKVIIRHLAKQVALCCIVFAAFLGICAFIGGLETLGAYLNQKIGGLMSFIIVLLIITVTGFIAVSYIDHAKWNQTDDKE